MSVGSFSTPTYNATIDEISTGLTSLGQKLEGFQSAVNSISVPGWLLGKLVDAANALIEASKKLISAIVEVFEGALAPLMFAKRAWDWSDDVKAPMVDLGDAVTDNHLITTADWDGEGYNAYKTAVSDQSDAANAVASIGDSMSKTLGALSVAGLAFYVAIGVIVVKHGATLSAAIATLATIFLAPVGIMVEVANVAVSAAEMAAAWGALFTLMGAEVTAMLAAKNALDNFPGSEWPAAVKD